MTDCHENTLSRLMGPARFPRAAQLEIGYWGSARNPTGEAYAVIGVPAAVVHAGVGSPSRAAERRFLHEHLAGGAIYRDEESNSYSALVAASVRQTWDDEDAVIASAFELVRIPHPARSLTSPTWCQCPRAPDRPQRSRARLRPHTPQVTTGPRCRRGASEVRDGEH